MQYSISQSQQILARAVAAHQAGNLAQAEFLYKLVLQADKKQFDALHMLGLIEAQRGNFAAGLIRLDEALRVRPKSIDALINLGRVQNELGHSADAIATYNKALALDPRSALAHSNLSILLRQQRRPVEALAQCDAALALAPDYAEAWNNRGNALFDLKRASEALESYDRALIVLPRLVESHLGRGNVLHQLQRYSEALAAYDTALAIKPNEPAFFGRGKVLQQLLHMDEALAAYDKALALKPDDAECHLARGELLNQIGRREDAYAAFAKAFALKPDLPYAEGARLFAKMHLCDWENIEAEAAHLVAGVREGALRSDPYRLFVASPSPADQMTCAQNWVADRYPVSGQPLWRGERYRHDRIRLAYVSSDLRRHAVAYLTAGMFEAHDRSRFETTAVSLGPPTNDEMRARLRGAFDRFIDVGARSDRQIAELLRELEIDIAVDLNGFTENARPGILTQRAVPVQVSYLGYSGTMGARYIDYILADQTVIAPGHAGFYTERIAFLPDTFMASDDGRRIAERTPTRQQCGLPETCFVFCCFNNPFKLTPETFHVWMRLLAATGDSVLWLSDANTTVQANLCREAERFGVSAQRLIFAPRMSDIADHLARQRQADLFLDTLPYNAHSTASDALWAGVPVLTCLGATFVGRVAASLLLAVGLPELVTEALSDYEALALKIAREPEFHAGLKHKLAHNRESFPLFDTKRFTRNIEAAYTTMWQRSQRGEPPQSFAVDPP